MTKAEQMTIRQESVSAEPSDLRLVSAGSVWEAARQLGYPVAMWRLPEKDRIQLIISYHKELEVCRPDLEELQEGFVISAYDNADNQEAFFINADLRLIFQAGKSQAGISGFGDALPEPALEIYRKALQVQEAAQPGKKEEGPVLTALPGEGKEEHFKRIVQLGVDAIRSGEMFKVVLSRTKEFLLEEGFDMAAAFFQLEEAYPSAFVSMAYLPETEEAWLGASPELLVEVSEDRFFRTTALAGTQKAADANGNLLPRFRVRWSEKEIEEQALVGRYIIECFKKIRLREYRETGPRSSLAGNVYHLRSDFEVDLKMVNFNELGSVMLRLLHPTSAVCGMPKEKAAALVNTLEGYDRSFYSGFWGPVNLDGGIHLFVNLRTLRMKGGVATLYAGAGITGDSDPQEEWEETELKCRTLLDVIDPLA